QSDVAPEVPQSDSAYDDFVESDPLLGTMNGAVSALRGAADDAGQEVGEQDANIQQAVAAVWSATLVYTKRDVRRCVRQSALALLLGSVAIGCAWAIHYVFVQYVQVEAIAAFGPATIAVVAAIAGVVAGRRIPTSRMSKIPDTSRDDWGSGMLI